MALCNVTGTLYLPDGSKAYGYILYLQRAEKGVVADYLGSVVPAQVQTFSTSDGSVDFNILSGVYRGVARSGNGVRGRDHQFTFTVPEAPSAKFEDCIADATPSPEIPGWLQQALAYKNEAEAAAAAATEAAGMAESSVGEVAQYIPVDARYPTLADRPAAGPSEGFIAYIIDSGISYRWSGTAWQDLGTGPLATKVEVEQSAAKVVGGLAKGRPRVRGGTPLAVGDDGSVVMRANSDRTVDVELSDDSSGMIGLYQRPAGRKPLRGPSPVLCDEEGAIWASIEGGKLNVELSDDANLLNGFYTKATKGRAPYRYRPFLVGKMPDGRIGVFAAWTPDGKLHGPWPDGGIPVSVDGTSGRYIVEGQYEGYLNGATAIRTSAAGKWRMNTAAIIGIMGYGQSWMVSNGYNGALPRFLTAPLPEFAMTLNDGRGVSGWNGVAPTATIAGMVDAREQITQWQSVVGPMAWRHSYLQQRCGGEATVFVRTEARAGSSLAQIAPGTQPYANYLRAVQGCYDAAGALGQKYELAVIPFIQGQPDKAMLKADYKAALLALTDQMQADAIAITGQMVKPQILIVTPPGDISTGQWELIQAQVELCHERSDYTLCGAGWALPQMDQTHFTSEACVALGEIFQIGLRMILEGREYSAPYIGNAIRTGTEIRFWIGGTYPVRDERQMVTRRHYLSDLVTPVPFMGFEYSGANILSAFLNPDGRSGVITLDADAPGRLWYAGHTGSRKVNSGDPDADESVNRGTLIADVEIPAIYSTERLTLGVSTFFKDL